MCEADTNYDDLRAKWANVFGDPSSPAIQAHVRQVAAALDARAEAEGVDPVPAMFGFDEIRGLIAAFSHHEAARPIFTKALADYFRVVENSPLFRVAKLHPQWEEIKAGFSVTVVGWTEDSDASI